MVFYDGIKGIEKEVTQQVKVRKEFELLKTIPGIGDILFLFGYSHGYKPDEL